MWIRLFKTNSNEVHAIVQVPKVMNSFHDDVSEFDNVKLIASYEHKFEVLKTLKQATSEHKVDRIIVPLRNPENRFWDGITVAVRDFMQELKEEHAFIACTWLAELVVTDPDTDMPGPTDHFMPYLDTEVVDWITNIDIHYTTFDIDQGNDYIKYWHQHHGVNNPPVSNKSKKERVMFRNHLIEHGNKRFKHKFEKFFEPVFENMKRLRNGSTPIL